MLLPFLKENCIETGCDEAGRGCLAGPVFAAAVILPENISIPSLNDSKQCSEKLRLRLRDVIEKEALYFSVVAVSPEEIDQINILNASIEGMHRAINALGVTPEHIIVDGNKFKPYIKEGKTIPHQCVIKGDGKYCSIAAASILAKTYRDDYMRELAKEYPQYGWEKNCGYPTKEHREAILKYGITPHHRQSYKLLPDPVLF
ncbi:MAG: ribonuclease HII [Bacteroidales bacterium]|nr:ribonuclease HII [Bacteroidales bacterium]MBO7256778.1 ribonuclease HII [Bacteroidales bacterium]MBO7284739.1 ribonuclease HII [Bacteroidales bacterium]MBO7322512.1 ribonuclease HII [Bacteroidales bacterium]MBR4974885.1 ribonuclease HII [Bacteroidales bacterium]